jgi:transposase-like protein
MLSWRWRKGRRQFTREFKVEAVRLVRERGVSVAQASRDLDVHENLLAHQVEHLKPTVINYPPRINREPVRCALQMKFQKLGYT